MALTAEVQQWLADLKTAGNLTDEAFKAISDSVEGSGGAQSFIKDSGLRQSDYSKKMAAIQAEQKSIEDARAEVSRTHAELSNWREGANKTYADAIAAKEAAEAKLRILAERTGQDPNDLAPTPKPAGGLDLEELKKMGFLTKADADAAVSNTALAQAAIHDLNIKHRKLFKEDLPNASQLVAEAIKAGRPLLEVYNEKFDVAKKTEEVAEAAIQERIKKESAEAVAKALSEAALGSRSPDGRPGDSSDVFSQADKLSAPLPKDHIPGSGVAAAVEAYNQRKHAQG